MIVFPHPSGISHFWNDKHNTQVATEALQAAFRLPLALNLTLTLTLTLTPILILIGLQDVFRQSGLGDHLPPPGPGQPPCPAL